MLALLQLPGARKGKGPEPHPSSNGVTKREGVEGLPSHLWVTDVSSAEPHSTPISTVNPHNSPPRWSLPIVHMEKGVGLAGDLCAQTAGEAILLGETGLKRPWGPG